MFSRIYLHYEFASIYDIVVSKIEYKTSPILNLGIRYKICVHTTYKVKRMMNLIKEREDNLYYDISVAMTMNQSQKHTTCPFCFVGIILYNVV